MVTRLFWEGYSITLRKISLPSAKDSRLRRPSFAGARVYRAESSPGKDYGIPMFLSKWSPRMYFRLSSWLKGCGMGPWLVLVSPCFRENEVATCKIGSFLCSLDHLLQKNVIVFFFGNQISKWRSFEKRAIFDLLFTFFSYQGKVTKILSAQISLTYIHVFCSPYWLFLPYQFWKKSEFIRHGFSLVWFLVLILSSRHFGTINK